MRKVYNNPWLPYDVNRFWEEMPDLEKEGLVWSGHEGIPVPKLGQYVSSRANFFFGMLQQGRVVGYSECDGYLGAVIYCEAYSDLSAKWLEHRVNSNGTINRNIVIYGAEIREVFDESRLTLQTQP